jgi:LysR family glycine cleavage system transcriptional activator
MNYPIPPVSVLRSFVAAVRFRNFSKAGVHLGVSQSAISHSIKDLEIIIGKQLFTRTARRTHPTADALILYEAIQHGFKIIHGAVNYCRSSVSESELIVSCFPGFAVKWLFPRLINFDLRYPGMAISLRTIGTIREIREDEADIGIHYGLEAYENYSVDKLPEEWLIPVCSPKYLADAPRLNSAEDLSRHTLLCDEIPTALHSQSLWGYWLEKHDLSSMLYPTYRYFGQSNMVIQAALEGRGVALGRTLLVVDDLKDGKLVTPFGTPVLSPYHYSLVTFDKTRKADRIAAFNAWIISEAKKSAQEFEATLNSRST